MPSAACQVKNGAGSFVPTTDGVNVTPGNVITVALANTAGADVWQLECISTDEVLTAASVNAGLVLNNTTKQATFTAPAAGSAMLFRSRVQTAGSTAWTEATFAVYTLAGTGFRVGAAGETFEGHATAGWMAKVNPLLRTGGGDSGGAPSGAAGGSLGGTYPNPTVAAVDGSVGSTPLRSDETVWTNTTAGTASVIVSRQLEWTTYSAAAANHPTWGRSLGSGHYVLMRAQILGNSGDGNTFAVTLKAAWRRNSDGSYTQAIAPVEVEAAVRTGTLASASATIVRSTSLVTLNVTPGTANGVRWFAMIEWHMCNTP